MGSSLSKSMPKLPSDWRRNFDRVRVLYRLTHNQTGQNIARRGWRLRPRTAKGNELVDAEGLPLMLDDSTINPEEWSIVSCIDNLSAF